MKKSTLSLCTLSLAASLCLAPALSASAATASTVRLAGDDRYQTAINISQSTFASADTVFIASGENFPDALSAGPAAAHAGAPVLLTPQGRLDARVDAEIKRLNPDTIVIVGGDASLSENVATALTNSLANATYKSISSLTAELDRKGDSDGIPNSNSVVALNLSNGDNEGDIDLGSGNRGDLAPLDLDGSQVGDQDYGLAVGEGSTDGIGLGVGLDLTHEDLGITSERAVIRVAGIDRYATSTLTADLAWGNYAGPAYVARGDIFPDALSGGAAAAYNGIPILLSPSTELSNFTADYLTRNFVTGALLFGSETALSGNVENQLYRILGESSGEDVAVLRVKGIDRFETAARTAAIHHEVAGRAYIATGTNYPDALAAIPAAALSNSSFVLTNQNCMPLFTAQYLHQTAPNSAVVLGGENAVATSSLTVRC